MSSQSCMYPRGRETNRATTPMQKNEREEASLKNRGKKE